MSNEYSQAVNALLVYLENLSDEDRQDINEWLDCSSSCAKLQEVTCSSDYFD